MQPHIDCNWTIFLRYFSLCICSPILLSSCNDLVMEIMIVEEALDIVRDCCWADGNGVGGDAGGGGDVGAGGDAGGGGDGR